MGEYKASGSPGLDDCLIRIVDDDERVLDALEFILTCEGYSVKTYANGHDFLCDDAPSRPGCVISDIRMPGMTGLELFSELQRRNYRRPLCFLTAHGDVEMAVDALKDGAVDYLLKPVEANKLFAAVSRALRLDRERRAEIDDTVWWEDRWAQLTSREKEVIAHVAEGLMSREIANRLDISTRTVEAHRASALHKLHLQTPAQVAVMLAGLKKTED